MTRTELRYFVDRADHGWIVRCEWHRYGPFRTLHDAVDAAIGEADAASQAGFCSVVLVRDDDRMFQILMSFGARA